jgi:carboxyl-terminal processing protease
MWKTESRRGEGEKKGKGEREIRGHRGRFCLLFSSSPVLLFSIFIGVTIAAQEPAPLPDPAPPPSSPDAASPIYGESDAFAFLLLESINFVGEIYVRPVSRVELLHTALTALYERARRPPPRDLRRRIERAEKVTAAQTGLEANAAPLVPAFAPRRPPVGDDRSLLDLLRAIRADLGSAEKLGGADPLQVACQAMLHSLDPYSGVISTKEDRQVAVTDPERDGFGLEVPQEECDNIVIHDVMPGSPAQQAGLRRGDEIVRIYDSDGRERKVKESLDVLNGRAPLLKPQWGALALPEPISIVYRRNESLSGGRKPPESRFSQGANAPRSGVRRATLEWRRFRPESVFGVTRRDDNSWNYWIDEEHKIAHLRLGNIVAGTSDEMSDIVAALRREGLRGLILDLRWCPGGALTGSYRTAELFLGEGSIATVQYRNQPQEVFRSTNENKHNDFPMVVLINSESTGGAEMIAAALQDHHRAVLIGQRSHGKGNVQKLRGIGTVGLKVTSGTIMRPNGKPLHRFPDSKDDDAWGVHPDPGHEFRLSPDLNRMLRTWWEEQTMRPGSSTQRLPLDDLLADPQRNAALETMVELLNRKVRAKAE